MRPLLALAGTLLAVAAASAAPAAAPVEPCAKPRVGFLGPLTGPAAFVGKEQLGHARLAAREHGGAVRVVEADTQLAPERAAAAARTLRANPQVLAVVGPAGSQEVLDVAPVLTRGDGRLGFVSPSAVAAQLTNGSIPGFFRVVPSDRVEAPTLVRLIARTIGARDVAVVDDGTRYSRTLAHRVQAGLRARGVRVTRLAVPAERTAFADTIARVPTGAAAVFLPFHVAATAQRFGEQLRRVGHTAVVVGPETLDSRDFTLPGSYVTAFARPLRVPGYPRPTVSKFGPAAYVAAQVAARAVRAACADGRATRREVLQLLRATDLPRTVLGGRLRFTAGGDVRGASYAVLQLPPR